MDSGQAQRAVEGKVQDARGDRKTDDGRGGGFLGWEPEPLASPLDEETLDEAVTQHFYQSRRRQDEHM